MRQMDIEAILQVAIESSPDFPKQWWRDRQRFTGCGTSSLTQENIDQRKRLLESNPAPERRRQLEAFVANLLPWVGKELVGGCLWTPTHRVWLWADPKDNRLIHWAEYLRSSSLAN
jgi:hypothetical protein